MVLALFARMLVPAGFMPMQGADGAARIVLCSGSGPMTMVMPMAGKSDHRQDDHQGHDGDHACPFAGFAALADFARLPAAPLPAVFAAVAIIAAALFARPGLGLAAPPPPKTGPPILR